jgi:alpha-tubulin suppressor-like RCC1 family protein
MRCARLSLSLAVCLALAGAGCSGTATFRAGSSASVDASTSPSTHEATGSVGMALTIASGVQFQALSWTITGPSGPYSGNVMIDNAQSIEFVTGGITAGGPYTMDLSGTDSAGDPCSGSAVFSVAPGAISNVTVTISCFYPTDAGIPADVTVGGEGGASYVAPAYNCPTITSLAVSPSQAPVGQAVQLDVTTTTAAGGAAGTPTLEWTATPSTGGVFSDPTSASPVFDCASPGTVSISVTAGLTASVGGADAGDVCSGAEGTSASTTINCEGPVAIAAGGQHTCALLSGGAVECWGLNGNGQLGIGGTTGSSTPVAVSGLAGPAIAIAAGGAHTCAIVTGGGIQCWGANASGQLGDGSASDSWTPVAVSGLVDTATAIAAGGLHTCALLSGGTVQCWGDNDDGQLGSATDLGSFSPAPLSVGITGVTALAAGYQHTCALLSTGAVSCWGDNSEGQLGGAQAGSSDAPVAVLSPDGGSNLAGVSAIGAGPGYSTCAVLSGGVVECWGSNAQGQLGAATGATCGSVPCSTTPVVVAGLVASAVASGGEDSYAGASAGAVDSWGDNGFGELGSGSMSSGSSSPVAVDAPGGDAGLAGVVAISAGGDHACALLSTGAVACWGDGVNGQLGNGGTVSAGIPVTVRASW